MRVGGKQRKRNSIIAAIAIGTIVLIAFIGIILHMKQNADYRHEVIFGEKGIQVTGLHGGIYEYNSITSVEIRDEIPSVLARTKGVAIGEVKKGTFELQSLGLSRLYLLRDAGPYLFIKVNDFYVILNDEVPEKVHGIYEQLQEILENQQ